jgi:hypothetical protein
MSIKDRLTVHRATTPHDRELALQVLRSVYREEKQWVVDDEDLLPSSDLSSEGMSWILALVDDEPVGVLRVLYELPLDLYDDYDLDLIDASVDVGAFLRSNRIAEIGRFAVVPEYRRRFLVAAALMRAAAAETVSLGFTHFVTDVFEGDPHSPFAFHRRVLGFEPVATHNHGELAATNTRITMLLDLRTAYERFQRSGGWIHRYIIEAIPACPWPVSVAGSSA